MDSVFRCGGADETGRWVADIKYVQTFSAGCTRFREGLSPAVFSDGRSRTPGSDLAPIALEMAIWSRRDEESRRLVHSFRPGCPVHVYPYAERLAWGGAVRSVGSKGDRYDNAARKALTAFTR